MSALRFALFSLLACGLLPGTTLALPRPDEVDAARHAFARAASTGDLEARRAALDALVELADDDLVPDLQAEFAKVSSSVRKVRDSVFRLRYRLGQKESLVANMRLREKRDPSLADSVKGQEERLEELQDKLDREERKLADLEPWFEVLGEGGARFFAALPTGKRRSVQKTIWKEIEEAPNEHQVLAAIELVGFCGEEGTAVDLQKRITKYCAARAKLERELPKLVVDLRKLEQRWQKEQEQSDGRSSRAMAAQYSRAKREAQSMQREITELGYLADACAEAGARALSRESGAVLEKSLQKLKRAQRKAQNGARKRTLRMIGLAGVESARSALHGLLETEDDPALRSAIIEVLTEAGDPALTARLLDPLSADDAWLVRSTAARALARLRVRDAIPVLIERLAVEDGRLRTDVREALVSLTGQNFRNNIELWRRWWGENEVGFEVPPVEEIESKASDEAKEAVGVTFFGIETESRRVLFVLDLSHSMTFSMVPRNNPDDNIGAGQPPDMPRDGELSRLQEARNSLTRALGGIEDTSIFNIIFYATDVWPWQDRPVEMEPETRAEALRFVDALDATGGTNIYGALTAALDMAGAEGGDEWSDPLIDTIYFLSDGRPSVGVTTDPDEILAFVRGRNASAGITIHTIGLSGAQDAYLLRSLAEQNGGIYVAR